MPRLASGDPGKLNETRVSAKELNMPEANENIRPPVVTIMGHVDHGKTTLLDVIRKTNVAAKEHGGITQHIGAYQIIHHGQPITFIDTPGHAAFEKMRSRGAQAADIVILAVAAGDGVKPQTEEAITHIKNAQKPMIVAITKVDLPDLSIEKVKKQLQTAGVSIEDYGGDVPIVQVSALKNKGIDDLLELIHLVWQLNPQKSLPRDPLQALVIESLINKNRGPVNSVIIAAGTIRVGQKIIVDNVPTTVRAIVDDTGKNIKEAFPGQPVQLLGFKKALEVGSIIFSQITTKISPQAPLTMADIIAKSQGVRDKFKVIIKADVLGSLEAIQTNLPPQIQVLSRSTGEINENDLAFAKIAHAPILAFNIKVAKKIKAQADRDGVIIKSYNVIYKLLEDIKEVAVSFQQVKEEAKVAGRAKIVAIFDIAGTKIAGAVVTHGKINSGDKVVVKGKSQEQEAKIISLKRFKKDTQTVVSGQDCGMAFDKQIDFEVGDIIESLG